MEQFEDGMQRRLYKWNYLGAGSSQVTFENEEQTLVFKSFISEENARYPHEYTERAIRVWNEINSGVAPRATESEQKLPEEFSINADVRGFTKGYLVPKIHGRQATDTEMKALILEIYNNTGRILLDAVTAGNCLTQMDGNCICVDIDLALKLEKIEDDILSSPSPGNSFSSSETWSLLQNQIRHSCLDSKENEFPLTVKTIKALIFIRYVRPDIGNVGFLNDIDGLMLLVNAYQEKTHPQNTPEKIDLAQDFLEQERPIHLSGLKSACVILLKQYLNLQSPSSPDAQERERKDQEKLICVRLMQDIQEAITSEEILQSIDTLWTRYDISQNYGNLRRVLGKCLVAGSSLYYANNRKSLINIAFFFATYVYSRENLFSVIRLHVTDLNILLAQILLPVFFMRVFAQPNLAQFFILVMVLCFLPLLNEFKYTSLNHISDVVGEKFTMNLLEAGFKTNKNNIDRFTQAFTPDYLTQLSGFIKLSYGDLLPAYMSLLGFSMAITNQDGVVGGMTLATLCAYLAYTYYFLNPRYANSFKINLTETQLLYNKLRTSIKKRDLVKFYGQQNNEKEVVLRVLKNLTLTTQQKTYYDAQTKLVGITTGTLILFLGTTWVSYTYEQSEKSIPDYILLYYYIYMFTSTLNHVSSLMTKVLSSAEYTQRLVRYSMWTGKKAQENFREKIRDSGVVSLTEDTLPRQNSLVVWQLNELAFHEVWYNNHRSKQRLENVTFRITEQSMFAFVGEQEGDSFPLVRLLRRKSTPLVGKITLNSVDIKAYTEESIYSMFTIIDSKDEFVEGLTWLETIKYGNETATHQQVLEAAFAAGLIESTSAEHIHTLKTNRILRQDESDVVGELIIKRRLAIARAVIKGGLCLILDNPTGGLAYHEERDILKTLIQLSAQITTLLITDKLYLLESYVGKIFYFHEGKIKEEGSYNDLMTKKAFFFKKLMQQKLRMRNLITDDQFYTQLTSEESVIIKNYHPRGYLPTQSTIEDERKIQEDESSLLL